MSEENKDSKPIKLKLTRRRQENLEKKDVSSSLESAEETFEGDLDPPSDAPANIGLKLKNHLTDEVPQTLDPFEDSGFNEVEANDPTAGIETEHLESLDTGYLQEQPAFPEEEPPQKLSLKPNTLDDSFEDDDEEFSVEGLAAQSQLDPDEHFETVEQVAYPEPEASSPEPAEAFPEAVPEAVPVQPIAPKGVKAKSPDAPKDKKSLIVSVSIILVLLGICGGSAFGIWFVLMNPSATETEATSSSKPTEQSKTTESGSTTGTANQGPIAKAQEVISQVPARSLDDIITPASDSLVVTEAQPLPLPPPVDIDDPQHKTVNLADLKRRREEEAKKTEAERAEEELKAVAAAAEQAAADAPVAADPVLVEAVSKYLGSIRIDGMRTGDNPKVMIGGISYQVGDVVETESGLAFDGIRDGKLAFKDKNDVVYLKPF